MLNFRTYLREIEGTNAQDASLEAEVRTSVLASMSRIQQLQARVVNDKSANNGQQQLSAEIAELASLLCLIAGVMTGDRVLVQRGAQLK